MMFDFMYAAYGESSYEKREAYFPGDVVQLHGGYAMRTARILGVQWGAAGNVTGYKVRYLDPGFKETYVSPQDVAGIFIETRSCHCGANSVKSPFHATYCPLHEESPHETQAFDSE